MMKKVKYLFLLLVGLMMISGTSYALEPEIIGPDVIYKQANQILTISHIKPLYQSPYGPIEVIEDHYTGFGDLPGIYQITLGVENKEFYKVIEIDVKQTLGDVIAVTKTNNQYTVHMFKNKSLTDRQIIEVLDRAQMITVLAGHGFEYLSNTYSENANSPGLYVFEFMMYHPSGVEQTYMVYIQVLNRNELVLDYIEPIDKPSNFNLNYVIYGVVGFVLLMMIVLKVKGGKKP